MNGRLPRGTQVPTVSAPAASPPRSSAPTDPAPTAAPESQAGQVADLLYTVVHALRRGGRSGTEDSLSVGQLRFLRTLARTGGTARPGELAARMEMTPRSVTTKVDLAQADGLVERRPDPTDRRAVVVVLTDRGADVLAAVTAARDAAFAARLARLRPGERVELARLLGELARP